ncbi:MAG TPA: BON domain-containing protein [Planctomycetaceae bacterium]|nr:BON domain-containing protein [Planctomycetaceae bacterium]
MATRRTPGHAQLGSTAGDDARPWPVLNAAMQTPRGTSPSSLAAARRSPHDRFSHRMLDSRIFHAAKFADVAEKNRGFASHGVFVVWALRCCNGNLLLWTYPKEIPMRYLAVAALVIAGCTENKNPSTSGTSNSGSPSTVTANKPVDRDNTAVNVRDRDKEAKTPIDQNEKKSDVKTTADIRKAVVDSKLSTDAENVKIITQDGQVTLRGPVESDDEKQKIHDIAVKVAGAGNVTNDLEVKKK